MSVDLNSLNSKQLEKEYKTVRQFIQVKSVEKRIQGLERCLEEKRFLTDGLCLEVVIDMLKSISAMDSPMASLKKMVPAIRLAFRVVSDNISDEIIFNSFLSIIHNDFTWVIPYLTCPIREFSDFLTPITLYLAETHCISHNVITPAFFHALCQSVSLDWRLLATIDKSSELAVEATKRIQFTCLRLQCLITSNSIEDIKNAMGSSVVEVGLVQIIQEILIQRTSFPDFDKAQTPSSNGRLFSMNSCIANLLLSISSHFEIAFDCATETIVCDEYQVSKAEIDRLIDKCVQLTNQPAKTAKPPSKSLTKDASNPLLLEGNATAITQCKSSLEQQLNKVHIYIQLAKLCKNSDSQSRTNSLSFEMLVSWDRTFGDIQNSTVVDTLLDLMPYNSIIVLLLEMSKSLMKTSASMSLAINIIKNCHIGTDQKYSYILPHQIASDIMTAYFTSTDCSSSSIECAQNITGIAAVVKACSEKVKTELSGENIHAIEQLWDSSSRLIKILHSFWSFSVVADSSKTIEMCDLFVGFLQCCVQCKDSKNFAEVTMVISLSETMNRSLMCLSLLVVNKTSLIEGLLSVSPNKIDVLALISLCLNSDLDVPIMSFIKSLMTSFLDFQPATFLEAPSIEKIQYTSNICFSSKAVLQLPLLTRIVQTIGFKLLEILRNNIDSELFQDKWYCGTKLSPVNEESVSLSLQVLSSISSCEKLLPILMQASYCQMNTTITEKTAIDNHWSTSGLVNHCISVNEGKFNHCLPMSSDEMTSPIVWISSSLASVILSSKSSHQVIVEAMKAIQSLCLDNSVSPETQNFQRDLFTSFLLSDGILPVIIGHLHGIPEFSAFESVIFYLIGRGTVREKYWRSAAEFLERKEASQASQTSSKKPVADKKPAETVQQLDIPCLNPDHNGGPSNEDWRHLLDIRSDDATRQHFQVTAVHQAAIFGFTKIVIELINCGADIDKEDKFGRSPLSYSLILRRDAVTDVLLQQRPNINKCDCNGNSLLKYCFMSYDANNFEEWKENLKRLISFGADLNEADNVGDFPLHWALLGTELAITIDKKSQIVKFDPFEDSSRERVINIVSLLIDCGCSINSVNRSLELSPLHAAILFGNVEIINFLLDCHANPACIDKRGRSPLLLTATISAQGYGCLFSRLLDMTMGMHHSVGVFGDNRKGMTIKERLREQVDSHLDGIFNRIMQPTCISQKRESKEDILKSSNSGIDLLMLAAGGLYSFGPGPNSDWANCYLLLSWRKITEARVLGPSDNAIIQMDSTADRQKIIADIIAFRKCGKASLATEWSSTANVCHVLSRRGDSNSLRMIDEEPSYFMEVSNIAIGQSPGQLVTPLHAAILSGSNECVNTLLNEKRVSVDVNDYKFSNIMPFLHFALTIGSSEEILRILVVSCLQHPNASLILGYCVEDSTYALCGTPLHISIRNKNSNLTKLLASSSKVDVNLKMRYARDGNEEYYASPIHVVSHQQLTSRSNTLTSLFKECIGRVDLLVEDSCGNCVIDDAILVKDVELIDELIALKPMDVAAKVVAVSNSSPVSIFQCLVQQLKDCEKEMIGTNQAMLTIQDQMSSSNFKRKELNDDDDSGGSEDEEVKDNIKSVAVDKYAENAMLLRLHNDTLRVLAARKDDINKMLLPITALISRVCPDELNMK